jgi:5-methyltetrahydrofolate--homocysteine methyltransferase
MNRKKFREIVRNKIVTLDGAIGTMLHEAGLKKHASPESAILEMADSLRDIHAEYARAGAQIILTNTLGATPLRLEEYGMRDQTLELNKRAIEIARDAVDGKAYVGLCVGPSGQFIQPLGELSFDQVYENFLAQAKVLEIIKPDIIVLETFSDLHELKAATIAFKEIADPLDIPIIAHMTFTEEGRTLTGADPETFAVVMEALGIDAVGVNCSVGPEHMVETVRRIAASTDLPVSVEPNAGLPEIVDGKAVYSLKSADFAGYVDDFIRAGANIIGSCCGSTPEFTRGIAAAVKEKKPIERKAHDYLRLASGTKTVTFKPDDPRRAIGERINPAGRKDLKSELKKGSMTLLRKEATAQEKAGAVAIDINISGYRLDEKALMAQAVEMVCQHTRLPVLIDNSNPEVVEAGLKAAPGKAMINSTSGEMEKLEPLVALAKRYGAAIVGVCLDESGIPETSDGRIAIGKKIIDYALSRGMRKSDIALDALVLSSSTGSGQMETTLDTMKKIKTELGCAAILGVSNISFGLPAREAVNRDFLTLALREGLDMPIVDPTDKGIFAALASFNLLSGLDAGGKRYIRDMAGVAGEGRGEELSEKPVNKSLSPIDLIREQVISGEKDSIREGVDNALSDGIDHISIVNDALVAGMKEVGERFNSGAFFLPQVILSAETMKEGFAIIKGKTFDSSSRENRGTVVIATVKGDVHDLGKNIVITLLESYSFNVIDLGKSVDAEEILDIAVKEGALCIALSALMTTTMDEMRYIADLAEKRGIRIPVVVGGAVITKSYADEIGVRYGRNAIEAVKVVSSIEKSLLE